MKRNLLTIVLLLFIFLVSYAQKETYFADKTSIPTSIPNLQGISANVEMQMYPENYSPRSIFPVTISYFNEVKLGKTTSVMFSGGLTGLHTVLDWSYSVDANGVIDPYSFQSTSGIGLQLSVGAAPRWYFALNNNVSNRKNKKIVSGFYLGLPVELMTTTLNSKASVQLGLYLKPSVGYRYSITDNIFVEASAGLLLDILHQQNSAKPFCAGLKLGYAFK